MRPFLMTTCAAVALVTASSITRAADNAAAPILGVWVAESLEADGKAAPPEAISRMRFNFKEAKLLVRGNFQDDREEECTYKIDPKQSPSHLEFTPAKEKKPVLGIYEVTGDKLKLCLRHGNSTEGRPTEFATKEGSQLILVVFKREKP